MIRRDIFQGVNELNIYLLDWSQEICSAWEREFGNEVNIINDNFLYFMRDHKDIDGVVSPANCFGIMDGGYDAAITKFFGTRLMQDVQAKILNEYGGIQPIATCISVEIDGFKNNDNRQMYLLHTPVMTTPETVCDYKLIFHAMRNTLIEALKCGLKNIVIPAWGGCSGDVSPNIIAYYMRIAYEQIKIPHKFIDWDVMMSTRIKLQRGWLD